MTEDGVTGDADADAGGDGDGDGDGHGNAEATRNESEARDGAGDTLDSLFATIEDRRERLPEGSYTASLFTHEKGENAVLEKLGEETTELVLAAKDDRDDEVLAEGADLVYHLLVLLAMHDLTVEDLRAELRDRF